MQLGTQTKRISRRALWCPSDKIVGSSWICKIHVENWPQNQRLRTWMCLLQRRSLPLAGSSLIWRNIHESHKEWEGFIILGVKNHQHLGTCYLPCQTLVKTLIFRGRWTFLCPEQLSNISKKFLSDLFRCGFVLVGLLIPDGWSANLQSGIILVLAFRKCVLGFSGLAFFMRR